MRSPPPRLAAPQALATRLIASVALRRKITSRRSSSAPSLARLRGRLDLRADPAVALLLELLDDLGTALLDDPPFVHDVHEVGLDEVQDPLVVGDDQDAHLRPGEAVDAFGHGRE